MKIEIHSPGGPDMTIPLPNAMLFSPTLLSLALKRNPGEAGNPLSRIPWKSLKPICRAMKEYTRNVGSWELLRVESGGARVTITI